jgi:hypothetical protein
MKSDPDQLQYATALGQPEPVDTQHFCPQCRTFPVTGHIEPAFDGKTATNSSASGNVE